MNITRLLGIKLIDFEKFLSPKIPTLISLEANTPNVQSTTGRKDLERKICKELGVSIGGFKRVIKKGNIWGVTRIDSGWRSLSYYITFYGPGSSLVCVRFLYDIEDAGWKITRIDTHRQNYYNIKNRTLLDSMSLGDFLVSS